MDQTVPRRLARFYRNQNQTQPPEDYSNPPLKEDYSQNKFEYTQKDKQNVFGSNQDKGIPSMDYDDVNLELDKRNLEEIKKLQEKNLVEKLALDEVEKFKVQNKRMPNSKEEEQIAENLYNQLKTNSINTSDQTSSRRRNKKEKTLESQNTVKEFEDTPIKPLPTNYDDSQVTGVKDLFGEDNEKQSKSGEKDEFDISIGDLNEENDSNKEEDIDTIDDTNDEEKSTCPNCKKQTEKIIYCSKCGTAFCINCAKTQENDKLCPKCKTRVKI